MLNKFILLLVTVSVQDYQFDIREISFMQRQSYNHVRLLQSMALWIRMSMWQQGPRALVACLISLPWLITVLTWYLHKWKAIRELQHLYNYWFLFNYYGTNKAGCCFQYQRVLKAVSKQAAGGNICIISLNGSFDFPNTGRWANVLIWETKPILRGLNFNQRRRREKKKKKDWLHSSHMKLIPCILIVYVASPFIKKPFLSAYGELN